MPTLRMSSGIRVCCRRLVMWVARHRSHQHLSGVTNIRVAPMCVSPVNAITGQLHPSERSQISRNDLTFHTYSKLRVFGREFLMAMKMVIAPLTLVSLAVLLVYTEPHISCVVMVLAKLAGHVSL